MDFVKFKVNGSECAIDEEVNSTTTLLEYLRNCLELRGTKYMCLEAGCGACIVSVKKTPDSPPESVNSCMVLVPSCHGWEVTTIEKVGNRLDGYHPLQTTLAETNGSQCGYCSPGFVMSMYSLLNSKKKLTMLEIERQLASNTCRCTGYRTILEAFKKFASDAPEPIKLPDIEDITICDKTKKVCLKNDCSDSDWCLVSKENLDEVLHITLKDGRKWYRAKTVVEIFQIFRREGTDSYMLVAGNTGKGVRPIVEYPRILIDVSRTADLRGYYLDQNLVIGAETTLTELINIFNDVSDTEYFDYLRVINDHLQLVAHVAVRNIGTVAGNLMLKHRYRDFSSDLFLLLQSVGAQLTIASAPLVSKMVTMENFLNENMTGKVILNVLLPPLSNCNKLVTFKVAGRSRNAHAIVNAAFFYKFSPDGAKVLKCRLAFGGLSAVFTRAIRTESYIVGKTLFDNNTLQSALKVLSNELVVTELPPEPSALYRKKLALALFYKGLLTLCPPNILNPRYRSGIIKLNQARPVSTGFQSFPTDPNLWPLNQPIPKVEALSQCAGEAKYVDDVPSLPREVFATFVLSAIARGRIDTIDASEALNTPGVIAFYTAKDIPGINSFTPPEDPDSITNEVILCEGEVNYFNQPIGIVVAESYDIANRASMFVKIKYSNVMQPEIDLRKNKLNPSKLTLYSSVAATDVGTDVAKVITGEQNVIGQYHFSLENLSCVSWPTEDGLKALPSSHYLSSCQLQTARCLNIDQSRVDMEVRRVGGSYGLKLSRAVLITTSCCLVTFKLNRPCRFIMPLRKQTRAVGKRMPSSTNYDIGVDKDGVIQYINYDIYDDNGYIVNELLIKITLLCYYNCYRKDRWNFRCFNVITDTPSNTWFRAPGSLETIIATETIMERISYELNLDPLQVRLNNLDSAQYGDLEEMVNNIIVNSDYAERRKAVDRFNIDNRWKKRGLRFVLMRWITAYAYTLNITLSVYLKDGSVAITHGGIELGQGINTKAIQVCAYFLKIPVSKVTVKASNTMANPNNSCTVASLSSQNVALGVTRCCKQLLERLEPLRTEMGNPTWEELIARAYKLGVNLQANGVATVDDVYPNNNVYGVTLAEVEIDVLTGESEILRIDLLEDAGRSVNPFVDIGQIEGGFTQGLGYLTSEELVYTDNGELLTDRTWNYYVPQTTDIPQDFRVYLRDKPSQYEAILGTKAISEPPVCMSIVIPIALREAIVSARSESGIPSNKWFDIDGPYTVEKKFLACETNIADFKLY